MFDNLTEQDIFEARGEVSSDEGEEGGGRHRISKYRKKILETFNQDLHHDLLCDGEGGESEGSEEEEFSQELDLTESEDEETKVPQTHRKRKNSSRP